jgi:hypothetical protein
MEYHQEDTDSTYNKSTRSPNKNLVLNKKTIKNIHRIREHWKTKPLKELTKEERYKIGN